VRRILSIVFLLAATPAGAHGVGAWSSDPTWTYSPWIVVPLYLAGGLYLLGSNRIWRRAGFGRGARTRELICFWTGWTVLALTLVSPLHWLSEQLLSAHMIEHELIMVVAAPLLVMARPLGAFLWALPLPWRRGLRSVIVVPAFAATWVLLTEPLAATLLHAGTVWVWHVPVLFDAAVANPTAHMAQHVSFLLTALLFWWAQIHAPRAQRGTAALHFFATMIAFTLLGALLALCPRTLYITCARCSEAFGFAPLEDQQLAGLMMWVPGCMVYAIAALAMLGQWVRGSATRVGGTPGLPKMS
jgi:putative membrane protein